MLRHIVSSKELEVDKDKIEVIQHHPLLATIQDLQSVLGHVGFYQRFIQACAQVCACVCVIKEKVPC